MVNSKVLANHLPSYVRPMPAFFTFMPGLSRLVGRTVYPRIYLPLAIVEGLNQPTPNPFYMALLIHEQVHYERQKKLGLLKFGLRYLFSPDFRLGEEKMAVRKALQYLKSENLTPQFDFKNKFAPENLYFWPLSKSYSSEDLATLWHSI
jgi:hypothetical protein